MYRALLALICAALVCGCATAPPPVPYDESKPLQFGCLARPIQNSEVNEPNKPKSAWFIHVIRNPPNGPNGERHAGGSFAARIRVWLTYGGNETELVTFPAGANEEFVPVRSAREVTVVDIDKCEAFEPLTVNS